jgi:hypothetical protein
MSGEKVGLTMAKREPGIVGFWEDEFKLLKAAEAFRDAGFKKFDTISPFPIHGMDDAMGLKRSKITYVCFAAGLFGCLFGLWFQSYVAYMDWPINVGGKPFLSWPAFIPVTFELTILFGGLASVAAMVLFCGLPKLNPPILDPDLTSHKFALFVTKNDPSYNDEKIKKLFTELNASDVREFAEF